MFHEYKFPLVLVIASIFIQLGFMAFVYFFDPVAESERIIESHKIISSVFSSVERRYLVDRSTIVLSGLELEELSEYDLSKIYSPLSGFSAQCESDMGTSSFDLIDFHLPENITLYTSAQKESLLRHQHWREAIDQYDYSYFHYVSMPCFLPGGQTAVVYKGYSCGPDCSTVSGRYLLLIKRGAGWHIVGSFKSRIS